MRRLFWSALAIMGLAASAGVANAQDEKPKDAGPLELKIELKEKSYVLDTGGKTQAEYKKSLEKMAEEQKKKPGGFGGNIPRAPQVEMVLSIVNTGKEDVTIFAGGDSNMFTFTVKGPGVVTLNSGGAFTTDFRLSRGIKIEAGKSHDIPVKSLMDGFRGASRGVYWTEPGDYTLTATYQLSANGEGQKGPLLTSQAVKLTVTEEKK